MTETLAEYLTDQGADSATVQHAVRYIVADLSNDLPDRQMREELIQRADDEQAVSEGLDLLSSDSATLLDVDLAVLSALWDDDGTREIVRGAIGDAKDKLPVVEVAIIALAAMYGVYMVVTKGQKRRVKQVKRTAEGWVEREEVEFYDFSAPVSALGAIVKGAFGGPRNDT